MSAASTAATESSQSMIVVTAASSTTSAHAGPVVATDGMGPVDHQLDVQSVVAEQDRGGLAVRTGVPDELLRVPQPDDPGADGGGQPAVGHRVGVDVGVGRAVASGTTSSRKARHQAITSAPRAGSYGPGGGPEPSASVP